MILVRGAHLDLAKGQRRGATALDVMRSRAPGGTLGAPAIPGAVGAGAKCGSVAYCRVFREQNIEWNSPGSISSSAPLRDIASHTREEARVEQRHGENRGHRGEEEEEVLLQGIVGSLSYVHHMHASCTRMHVSSHTISRSDRLVACCVPPPTGAQGREGGCSRGGCRRGGT